MSNQIEVIKLNEDVTLPQRMTPGSAGMDLYAYLKESVVLYPGQNFLVPTSIAINIKNPNIVALIYGRSGLAKVGVRLGNSVGVVDSDYQKEIFVLLFNDGDAVFTINNGERIAQLVFTPVYLIDWNVVDEFSTSTERTGGFGSTGITDIPYIPGFGIEESITNEQLTNLAKQVYASVGIPKDSLGATESSDDRINKMDEDVSIGVRNAPEAINYNRVKRVAKMLEYKRMLECTDLRYPITVEKTVTGFFVSFQDIPEALTEGQTMDEALEMARDALETALEFYFEDERSVPIPSIPAKDQPVIELSTICSSRPNSTHK